MSRRELVLDSARDAARDFAYYGREEDEELSSDDLKAALLAGEVTLDDIVAAFRGDLVGWAGLRDKETP